MGTALDRQGLDIDGITRDQWEEFGRQIQTVGRNLPWVIGDWWNAGVKWGEGPEACERFGLNYSTVRQYAALAAEFPIVQRVEQLTWSHHRIVIDSDDRQAWLQKAADNNWNTRQLAEALDGIDPAPAGPQPLAPAEQQAEAVARYVAGEPASKVAPDYGVSVGTIVNWAHRLDPEGAARPRVRRAATPAIKQSLNLAQILAGVAHTTEIKTDELDEDTAAELQEAITIAVRMLGALKKQLAGRH